MSQMPDKIWLHKNTKYSTGDMVCGYQYDFVQGIEDEGGIENFVEYVPVDAFIEKAANWLRTHSEADYFELIPDANYCGAGNLNKKKMIEDFKKYMEE